MIDALGHERLMYVVGQRIGSHHVHGTWPSLRMHYLEDAEDGRLRPRDHDCETHVNQFYFVPLAVLDSIGPFVRFVVADEASANAFNTLLKGAFDDIMKLSEEFVAPDFENAPQE